MPQVGFQCPTTDIEKDNKNINEHIQEETN